MEGRLAFPANDHLRLMLMSFEKGRGKKERKDAGRTDDVTAAMGNLHAWREEEEEEEDTAK